MISERFGQPGHRASNQCSKGIKVKSQQVMTQSSKAGYEISRNQHMGEKKTKGTSTCDLNNASGSTAK